MFVVLDVSLESNLIFLTNVTMTKGKIIITEIKKGINAKKLIYIDIKCHVYVLLRIYCIFRAKFLKITHFNLI